MTDINRIREIVRRNLDATADEILNCGFDGKKNCGALDQIGTMLDEDHDDRHLEASLNAVFSEVQRCVVFRGVTCAPFFLLRNALAYGRGIEARRPKAPEMERGQAASA